jgi:hypothetical protein
MGIEVRSSTNRSPVYGNLKEDYKGVKEAMGLPISIVPFPPISLGILTSTLGDEGGVSLLDLGGFPDLFSTSISDFFVCEVSLFCGGLSVSRGTFLGFPFFCSSHSKPRGTFSCSWGRVIASPCSTCGRPLCLCF